MTASSSSSTQHTPIVTQHAQNSRARFHSPNIPTQPYFQSPPSTPTIILSTDDGHSYAEDELEYPFEKVRSPRKTAIRWSLPEPPRKAKAERRRIWVGLGMGASLGLVLLVYVLTAKTGSAGWESWGLVNDMDGLLGGDYLEVGDWRGIDPAKMKGSRGGYAQAVFRTGGRQKAKIKGKGKSEGAGRSGTKAQSKGKSHAKGKGREVDDGLYRFNPSELVEAGGPHPITTLIHQARAEWAEKVARQSSTLKAAVEEYRRRYGRAPPKGFEKWWAYVKQHNVPLPDEYDQISRDIHLFHPHLPSTIAEKMKETAKLSDTFRIKNTGGTISVHRNFDPAKHPGGEHRIKAQLAMVEGVAKHIGDFEAVWSVHDNGRLFTSWSQRNELEEAVRDGTSIDYEDEEVQHGWAALCPTSTNFGAALSAKLDNVDTSSTSKSFISSLPKSMSICSHPSIVPIHGATAGPYRLPSTTAHLPLFSYSRTSAHSDILGIPYSHLVNLPPTAWEAKTNPKLLWRGGLTGAHYDERVNWRQTQRFRLLDLTNNPKNLSLIIPHSSSAKIIPTTYFEAAQHYIDVAPTGAPIQCDKPTCDAIAADYDFAPRMSHAQAAAYKYVLDVDGNAWSARFKGLLSTGSVVLKSTIMPEWWTDRSQAWVHYVPVDVGYTDMMDIMAYFTGDFKGQGGNDAAGKQIGKAGQEWVKTHWREEDMVAYSFRLYLEWARVWGGGDRKVGYMYDPADEV